MRDEQEDAVDRAADQSPIGALPAVRMLEAGQHCADQRHQLKDPVSGS
jgi:hypothetical protein